MQPIFASTRPSDCKSFDYRLMIAHDADDNLVVSVGADTTEPTIVLTREMTTALLSALGDFRKRFIDPDTDEHGLPVFIPATCGTGHLFAERTLRLVSRISSAGGKIDGDCIEMLSAQVHQAGIAFAIESLKPIDDGVPF